MSSAPESVSDAPAPVLVHVLFMDVVHSTKYPIDEQRRIVETLQTDVRATSEYRKAVAKGELISLPTGDGMALVFLADIEAPLRCAIELSRALRQVGSFEVRMGIHSGVVFIVEDINGNRNVSGAGINGAQRVMDCGDGKHILLSDAAGDALRQLSHWKNVLHDIGDCKAKDGWYHVWSYFDADLGNPGLPRKSRRLMRRRRAMALAIAVGLIAASAVAVVLYRPRPPVTQAGPERDITYSVLVKPPKGPERVLAKEAVFPPHYGLKFRFQAVQPGFLYLLNEGPEQAQARAWHWLFPYLGFHAGSGAIESGDIVTLPAQQDSYYELDEKSGREIIFVIWSDREIPELEEIKKQVFKNSEEGMLSRDQVNSAQAFLDQHSSKVDLTQGGDSTTLRSHGAVLVHPLALEHM